MHMTMEVTEDDFLAWTDHPLTQWVFQAVEKAAGLQAAEWNRQSWDKGLADPLKLAELRTRADAYRALTETDYDGWSAIHES